MRRRLDVRSIDARQGWRIGRDWNGVRLSSDGQSPVLDIASEKANEDQFAVVFLVRTVYERQDCSIELFIVLLIGRPIG